jgi:hypothetical protein
MGKVLAVVIVLVTVWGALAQIMPDAFQIRRETHPRLMNFVFGRNSIWIAVMMVGAMLGWYIWHLEARLTSISTLSSQAAIIGTPMAEPALTFVGWTADQSGCQAQIDASRLPDEARSKFDLAIVCGFSDPSTDQLKDTRITVSQLFTVQNTVMVAAAFGSAMLEALARDQKSAIEKLQFRLPSGMKLQVANTVWIKAILLPKGFDAGNIHRLADVPMNGGRVSNMGVSVVIVKDVPAK